MKVTIHNDNGFIYYEAIAKGVQLLAYKFSDLVSQLWSIYRVDLRDLLFNSFNWN